MSPATHAMVGAAIASRFPRLWVALPLAFASHFVCDAIYHFEAFYPLSRWLGVSHSMALIYTFAAMSVVMIPMIWRVARKDRDLLLFCFYLAASLGVAFIEGWGERLATALLVAGAFLWLAPNRLFCHWVVCGLAANLGDILRPGIGALDRIHKAFHYDGMHDLGDVIYRWLTGSESLEIPVRIYNPYYQAGYLIELAGEVALLLGALYAARRWRARREPSVADLPAVDEQARAGYERRLVR